MKDNSWPPRIHKWKLWFVLIVKWICGPNLITIKTSKPSENHLRMNYSPHTMPLEWLLWPSVQTNFHVIHKKATLCFITPHCELLVKYCSHSIVLVKLQTWNLMYCRQHLRRNLYQMFSACSSFRYVLSVTGSDWPSFTDCGSSCRDWNLFSLTRCDILF